MSRENVDVVLDQFEAANERDFRRAMDHYADDVELSVDSSAFLNGGTFRVRPDGAFAVRVFAATIRRCERG